MTELVFAVLWSAIEGLLILTGALVVRTASWGRWRTEHWGSNEARIFGAAGALSFRREGRRVVTTNGLVFAGLLFYVLLVLVVVGLSRTALA